MRTVVVVLHVCRTRLRTVAIVYAMHYIRRRYRHAIGKMSVTRTLATSVDAFSTYSTRNTRRHLRLLTVIILMASRIGMPPTTPTTCTDSHRCTILSIHLYTTSFPDLQNRHKRLLHAASTLASLRARVRRLSACDGVSAVVFDKLRSIRRPSRAFHDRRLSGHVIVASEHGTYSSSTTIV
jgi:hypothetical protein